MKLQTVYVCTGLNTGAYPMTLFIPEEDGAMWLKALANTSKGVRVFFLQGQQWTVMLHKPYGASDIPLVICWFPKVQ